MYTEGNRKEASIEMETIYQSCLRQHSGNYLFSVFLVPIVTGVVQFLYLPFSQLILNNSYEGKTFSFGAIAGMAVVFLAIYLLCLYLRNYCINRFKAQMIQDCKTALLSRCTQLPPEQIQQCSSGKFVQSFQQVEVIAQKNDVLANMSAALVGLIFVCLYLILSLHWALLLCLVLLLFMVPLFQGFLNLLVGKQMEILSQGEAGISATEEYLQRLELIKSYRLERVFLQKYHNIVEIEKGMLCQKAKYTLLMNQVLQKLV